MAGKRAYLLATANKYEMEDIVTFYDETQQVSIVTRGEMSAPLVSEQSFGRTESKTMQAPGDDDPDPEDEGCY